MFMFILYKMADGEVNYGTTIPIESLKVIAESIGLSNLSDECAKEISDDITHRVKVLLQDAKKFAIHSKRSILRCSDIDDTLDIKHTEPLYGFSSTNNTGFRFASGGGRELHFTEDKELNLSDFPDSLDPKPPFEVSIRSHWLAIDGVQPAVPENPPTSIDGQKLENADSVRKLKKNDVNQVIQPKPNIGGPIQELEITGRAIIKPFAVHMLSIEQQIYFQAITEACVGSDEQRRTEALNSLSTDPGMYEMLPNLCSFISCGVRTNVVQHNLALLIYLMRMVKALFENTTLYIKNYLHILLPSVITCVVSFQLCVRPELDNHWALRDFAARILAGICKTHDTPVTKILSRVLKFLCNILHNEETPLSTLYGAIEGLAELGSPTIQNVIIPMIKTIGSRLEAILENTGSYHNSDKNAATQIKNLLTKISTPILKTSRSLTDTIDDYRNDYGYLGSSLHIAVSKARCPGTLVKKLGSESG